MSQIDTIYSAFDQLTTWEQYRDLLIETLTASGYLGLGNTIRSGFTENHFDNPELLAQFIVPLFSTHALVSNRLFSGTDPLDLLLKIHRSRNLLESQVSAFDAGWTTNGEAQVTGGQGRLISSGGYSAVNTPLTLPVANLRYQVSLDVVAAASGTIRVDGFIVNSVTTEIFPAGTGRREVITRPTAVTGTPLQIARNTAPTDYTVDNVAVRLID